MVEGLKTNTPIIMAVEWLIRILLGLTFIYASIDKIAHPQAFAQVILNYQIIPARMAFWMAQWLPWMELAAGLSLISGWRKTGGATIIALLLIVFSIALGMALFRGIDIQCGCFSTGSSNDQAMIIDLLRDVVLLALAGTLIIRFTSKKSGLVVRKG